MMTRHQLQRSVAFCLLGVVVSVVSVTSLAALEVRLGGMAPIAGQRLEARLIEVESGMEVARSRVIVLDSEEQILLFSGLQQGSDYLLDIYADVNGNGRFDPLPTDPAWRIEIANYRDPTTFALPYETGFAELQWPDEEAEQESVVDGVIASAEYAHYFYDAATGISVHWSNDASTLTMSLVSPGIGWVSAGFDPVRAMQGANFILAAMSNGALVIEDHYGTGPFRHTLDPQQDILAAAGVEADGKTTVEFSIPLDSGDENDKPLIPGESYTLLLAYNSRSDNMAQRHTARSVALITLDQP